MANADPAALGRLFDKSPEKRKRFHEKPKEAASEAGLPAELAEHFGSLNRQQLQVLASTWDKLGEAGLKQDVGGVTVSFF